MVTHTSLVTTTLATCLAFSRGHPFLMASLKALCRRGQALYKLGRLQKANQDLAMAVAMEPKDVGIQQLLTAVGQAMAGQLESSYLEDGEYEEDR